MVSSGGFEFAGQLFLITGYDIVKTKMLNQIIDSLKHRMVFNSCSNDMFSTFLMETIADNGCIVTFLHPARCKKIC